MTDLKKGEQIPEHSPKLKMASLEIKAILEKYDIAGVVQLFIPGHNEYTMNISPSFSCVSVNDVGQLKITPPIEQEDPAPAKQKIADTVNMLANMRLYTGKLSMVLTQAEIAVRQHFGIATPKGPNNITPPFKNGRRP